MKDTDEQDLINRTQAKLHEAAEASKLAQEIPPASGQLYVFPGDGRLEWTWLSPETEQGQALLLPVDTFPLCGSADVASQDDSHRFVRCRFRVRMPVERLQEADLCGALGSMASDQARDKSEHLAAGFEYPPSEVDSESEYREWLDEIVAPEVEALERWTHSTGAGISIPGAALRPVGVVSNDTKPLEAGAEGTSERSGSEGAALESSQETRVAPFNPRPAAPRLDGFFKAAAAVLLTTTLGFGYLAFSPSEAGSLGPEVEVNVPLVWLGPEEIVRGSTEALSLESGATAVVFVLLVNDLDYTGAYRAEVYVPGEVEPRWSVPGLKTAGVNEVTLAIPRSWLDSGMYRLVLRTEEGPQSEGRVVGTYRVQIESPGSVSPVVP